MSYLTGNTDKQNENFFLLMCERIEFDVACMLLFYRFDSIYVILNKLNEDWFFRIEMNEYD